MLLVLLLCSSQGTSLTRRTWPDTKRNLVASVMCVLDIWPAAAAALVRSTSHHISLTQNTTEQRRVVRSSNDSVDIGKWYWRKSRPIFAIFDTVKFSEVVGEMRESVLRDWPRTNPLICSWRAAARPSERLDHKRQKEHQQWLWNHSLKGYTASNAWHWWTRHYNHERQR